MLKKYILASLVIAMAAGFSTANAAVSHLLSNNSNYPTNEGPKNATDNNANTKYLNFGAANTGLIVTLAKEVAVKGIAFTTANDSEERDPASFQIFGTNDEIVTKDNGYGDEEKWTKIAEGDLNLPVERKKDSAIIEFANDKAFKSFKIVFPTLRDSDTANSMQIANVQLFDADKKALLNGESAIAIQAVSGDDTIATDPYYGDWVGNVKIGDTYQSVQVCMLPLGGRKYEARFFEQFGKQDTPLFFLRGTINDGKVKFINVDAFDLDKVSGVANNKVQLDTVLWSGTESDLTINGTIGGNLQGTFTLSHGVRFSPTLGAKAPKSAKAKVLFNGKNFDNLKENGSNGAVRWKLIDDAMEVDAGDIVPKEGFGDCIMHIEFRSPYYPDRFGQARGNSGVYVNGSYEVQVLDSYGLPGYDNECGGIYQNKRPLINACLPPMYWQTYDIDFTAPRFDADGKKVKNARITLKQNGLTLYEDYELPGATPGAINPTEKNLCGFLLQNHGGDKVQYRNIWVVTK